MSFGEGNLHDQIERLKEVNGSLCDEINRQERVIESQLRKIDALEKERDQWIERCIDAEVGRQSPTSMSDLKPCPFCGKDDKLALHRRKTRHYDEPLAAVKCSRCGIRGRYQMTDERAAKAWNTRAELDYIEDKSRWAELFGAPERAAKTLSIMQRCELGIIGNCDECEMRDVCRVRDGDYDALLGWLRGDAE